MVGTLPARDELAAFAGRFVSGVAGEAALETLEGGSLNYVWRIRSASGSSFVIKHAPPYVASIPEIALDAGRIGFEAGILKAFQLRSELNQLAGSGVRPPVFLGYDSRRHLLLMEDVGVRPTLLQAVGSGACDVAAWGSSLGNFIAQLHVRTFQNQWFADHFVNLPVQRTRLEIQYKACLEFCRRVHMPDAEIIGRRCRQLGQKLNSVGKCLIMGDLWPDSILPGRNDIRLIDWELTHFGRPAQDVAHLAAHLWMMAHRSAGQSQKQSIDQFRVEFITSYFNRIARQQPQLMTGEDKRDFQIHFGAEILARTLGPFQKNYLYDGLSPQHPVIQEAVEEARQWIHGAYDPSDRKEMKTES